MSLFGLDTTYKQSRVICLPIPWEVTTSYGSGASLGPQAILDASPQLDLYTYDSKLLHNDNSLHLKQISTEILEQNNQLKVKAQKVIQKKDAGQKLDQLDIELIEEINRACSALNDLVYNEAKSVIADGKVPTLIGGDHSCPYGLIKAISEEHRDYDVLHIDAHLDLRKSYQGFHHSHASIMNNTLNLVNPPQDIISVGIRDYCEEEMDIVKGKNLTCFTNSQIKNQMFDGVSFNSVVNQIVNSIKNPVYISFDIDGLEPRYCPNTGTPVPGGLTFDQAVHIIQAVAQKHKVISFDLCEVAPASNSQNQWDGNVGARILFNLFMATLTSLEQ